MQHYHFVARCGEESYPIDVALSYERGKQVQQARRLAVGKLLAYLAIDEAQIEADGEARVYVRTRQGDWVIDEGGLVPATRGAL
ncbi:MAG: hypothetical protein AAF513_15600 [Pseudomonadota bacterium]